MSIDKFWRPLFINPSYRALLCRLWDDAYRWTECANGQRDAFNNPIGRMIARDLARRSLDQFCQAIDDLLPKDPA